MSERSIQEYLFQRIREQLPASESLAEAVAGLLYVSNDSAYRRIRGETPLVLEEARVLCEAYNISLDALLGSTGNTVTLTAVEVNNGNYSFELYLKDMLSSLKAVSGAQQKEIIYLTKDIPVFYNFLYRPLFAFRYFFWMKSILQHPDFISVPFSANLLTPELERLGKEINMVYNAIPSVEIWNTECINSTIAQVEYYREAGYFRSGEDVQVIYEALHALILHLKSRADAGIKFLPGESGLSRPLNYRFFCNRVVLGDNTILALTDGKKQAFLSYDVLNYMTTTDEKLCSGIHNQLEMLMRRSTLISNTSEKQRHMFFNLLLKKIPSTITNPSML